MVIEFEFIGGLSKKGTVSIDKKHLITWGHYDGSIKLSVRQDNGITTKSIISTLLADTVTYTPTMISH